MDIQEILEYKLFEAGEYSLTVYRLAMLAVIFIVVKLLLWSIKKAMERRWRFKKLDPGSQQAIFQIIRYIIWIVAIVLVLETVGVKVTILIAGSAALLVGIGLGLQQTFNDIVSGIILLVEGSTKVGDVLQVDSDVVRVRQIGLRASKVVNRDNIILIIPNSLIVNNKVINWSHQTSETRYRILVGIAYGSDVELAIKLIEESAKEHPECSKENPPIGRLVNFGESSLDLELNVWSKRTFGVEQALSDIRRAIDRKFRENGVTIPFPQRDLHLKASNTLLRANSPASEK